MPAALGSRLEIACVLRAQRVRWIGIDLARERAVRHACITIVAGLALGLFAVPSAHAEKAKKPKVSAEAPVLSPRADAALVLRADRVKDLPTALDAADRKALTSAAALLRADKHDAARATVERWAAKANGRVSQDDAIFATLWVARTGGVSRLPEMVEIADRVRFADERVGALTMTLAELKNGASVRGTTAIDVPVATHYAGRLVSAREMRTDHVSRDDLPARLAELEADYATAVAESDALHAKFAEHEAKNRRLVESIVAIVNAGTRVQREPASR